MKVYQPFPDLPESLVPGLIRYGIGVTAVDRLRDATVVLLPRMELLEDTSELLRERAGLSPSALERARDKAHEVVGEAERLGLAVVAVKLSDEPLRLQGPTVIRFSTELTAGTELGLHDYALPAFPDADIGSVHGGPDRPIAYEPRPAVGFRGSARLRASAPETVARDALTALNRTTRGRFPVLERYRWSDGQLLRSRAMRLLERHPHVDTDFQRLTRGYIGADEATKQRNRAAFVGNLADNPYSLCVRGLGNYSFRFYESLSMGRIPLFVNTACRLPFDHEVDWQSECVWVEQADVGRIGDVLCRRHEQHDAAGFVQMQQRARWLYDRYCSPRGFWAQASSLIRTIQ